MRKMSAIIVASLFWIATGCADRKAEVDCAPKLREQIRIGTSETDAERILDSCGFVHSFDAKTSTVYALKRGDKGVITREDWRAEIKLSDEHKVTSVSVEKIFTGS